MIIIIYNFFVFASHSQNKLYKWSHALFLYFNVIHIHYPIVESINYTLTTVNCQLLKLLTVANMCSVIMVSLSSS